MTSRSKVVSSFTIIKGSLIDETFSAFREWDFEKSRLENLDVIREGASIAASSSHWARDVAWVISRRFDPNGRDRALVELAAAGCDRELWKPILLFHMTRDEFLVRDFLVSWLYRQFSAGVYRLGTDDVRSYLESLKSKKEIAWQGNWSESTIARVASGLLRIAADFGILEGRSTKEFASYHLPDASFVYLLHAMSETTANARNIVDSPDWHMYMMDSSDVERELFRLHQYSKVHYEVAGSLAQLKLPKSSSFDYAKEMCL